MADFHVRSESVDVEQIMAQIRTRIREKRGADYTEAELQQLASVKLEKFLDSRGVRSTLVEAFRKTRVPSPEPPSYEFTDETLFESPRPWLRRLRRWLAPILRLFVNPDRLSAALRVQKEVNADFHRRFRAREEMDPLYYEVVHNLVFEITRLGIDAQNLKMRVESLASRLDFDERRARSLEGLVQRRGPEGPRPDRGVESGRRPEGSRPDGPRVEPSRPAEASGSGAPAAAPGAYPSQPGGSGGQEGRSDEAREHRRRRRRRRRRPGQNLSGFSGQSGGPTGGSAGQPIGRVASAGPPETAIPDEGGGDEGGMDEPGGSEDPHQ